jgi:hypothetical protein
MSHEAPARKQNHSVVSSFPFRELSWGQSRQTPPTLLTPPNPPNPPSFSQQRFSCLVHDGGETPPTPPFFSFCRKFFHNLSNVELRLVTGTNTTEYQYNCTSAMLNNKSLLLPPPLYPGKSHVTSQECRYCRKTVIFLTVVTEHPKKLIKLHFDRYCPSSKYLFYFFSLTPNSKRGRHSRTRFSLMLVSCFTRRARDNAFKTELWVVTCHK